VLGETNEVTLISLHNLAVEYANLNENRKAIELNEKVYALRCETIGETHPDSIITLHNIATLYMNLNDVQTAVTLFEKAYLQSKTMLSEEHPNTLSILDSLAKAYQQMGQHQKSIKLFEKLHAIRLRIYGNESREMIWSLQDLSQANFKARDFAKAIAYLESSISLSCKVYGPKSNYVKCAISRFDNYAIELLSKGDFSDSAFNDAMLFWIKAYDYRYYYLGLWDDETDSNLEDLVGNISNVSDPERLEEILERIYEALMKLRDLVYFGSYKGTTQEGFHKMNSLLKVYCRYGTIQKRIELLEMFYTLCLDMLGENAKATVKFKKQLEEEKALLD
jgi:tetratricopeptide (TPR) repeat protein